MEGPRFQFTLRDVISATYWAAVGMAAWAMLLRTDDRQFFGWPLVLLAAWLSPVLMVASLLGGADKGFVFGSIVVVGAILISSFV